MGVFDLDFLQFHKLNEHDVERRCAKIEDL